MQLFVTSTENYAVRRHCGRRKEWKVPVMKGPRVGALVEVHAQEFILEVAKVSTPIRQRSGPGDVRAGLDLLQLLAVGERNDVQQGIAPTEDGSAFRHGR